MTLTKGENKSMKNRAFTLIELLVVVLIIGILAAIALPQYRKAVTKSRYGALKSVTRSFYEAERAYILQNGHWTTNFKDLDLTIKGVIEGNYMPLGKNRNCLISTNPNYIYCENYNDIGLAYLITEAGIHYCVSATPGDNIPTQICKEETGKKESGNGYWYRYN